MKFNFLKLPLFSSIILLVFSCILFLFLYIKTTKNNSLSAQMRIEWQDEAHKRDEIRSFEQSLKMIEEERNLLQTHFAQSSDVVPFLDTIEKLAQKVNAKAEVVGVYLSKDGKDLFVEMEASGNFASTYKFITLLENSPYELEIMSMDLQKSVKTDPNSKNKTTSEWRVTLELKLLSFIK